MKGKGIKVFGVVMALLLVFSFAATFSVSSTSVVSAGTQKWTKISIPGTDDMQLAPGTDIGSIAVSPDGLSLFAAVITGGNWAVYKSTDGGYTWDATDYVGDGTPTERIVAIRVSPAWADDDVVVVATTTNAYVSEGRGKNFVSMGATAIGTISSMDVALDADGDATYVIGTNSDVYILSGFGGWVAQLISIDYQAFNGVYAVAFSPNYGEDGVVFAFVEGQPSGLDQANGAHLRAETDIEVHNWGDYIDDAHFMDQQTGVRIDPDSACLTFAEDYNSAPSVFVGLTSYYNDPAGLDYARGDAFRVDLVMGAIGTSAVTDLNIRGSGSRTNVYSLAVSGEASSAFILAGIPDVGNAAQMTTWTAPLHYSQNGGESWLQCYKPPSGMTAAVPSHCAPIVLMAPDFAESGIAYASNGYIASTGIIPAGTPQGTPVTYSGFYASTTQGTTFNGRGLLDHSPLYISDVVPSPDYDNDSTLFMVTNFGGAAGPGLLWETTNGGSTWELILGMTLLIPLPGVFANHIEVPATYPDEPSVFITGPTDTMAGPSALIARSVDEGNLFATAIKGPYTAATPLPVQTWVVIDKQTLIVSNANNIWKTDDMGAHWDALDDTEIATGETVIDMQIFNDTTTVVSTNQGNVYICQNWETDFSFVQVAEGPGVAGDSVYVAFDANFDDNGMIYAGVDGSPATCGIWRIDANSGDTWEQIWDTEDVYSIATDGNGILWAISEGAALQSVGIREVNPAAPIDDILPGGDSPFEKVSTGLVSSELWTDLETAPTQTYVFALGGTATTAGLYTGYSELWAYIDTLIQPTLISPACGATAAGTIIQGTSTARVSLMWDDLAKAQYYDYEVAYDDGFGSIASSGWLEGTQVSVNLFLGEQFYWRVRVNGSVFSKWSEVCSFTTPLGPASAKPIITYPGATDSHNDIELTPSLTWTSTVEATGFELILAANCDWANPIVNLTGSSALVGPDTCYAVTQALQEGTNYCWKVRAVNSDTDTMSPWSDTGTFTTLVTPVVEDEGTPMWVWVVIALSAVLLVGVVVLIVRTRRPV